MSIIQFLNDRRQERRNEQIAQKYAKEYDATLPKNGAEFRMKEREKESNEVREGLRATRKELLEQAYQATVTGDAVGLDAAKIGLASNEQNMRNLNAHDHFRAQVGAKMSEAKVLDMTRNAAEDFFDMLREKKIDDKWYSKTIAIVDKCYVAMTRLTRGIAIIHSATMKRGKLVIDGGEGLQRDPATQVPKSVEDDVSRYIEEREKQQTESFSSLADRAKKANENFQRQP